MQIVDSICYDMPRECSCPCVSKDLYRINPCGGHCLRKVTARLEEGRENEKERGGGEKVWRFVLDLPEDSSVWLPRRPYLRRLGFDAGSSNVYTGCLWIFLRFFFASSE